MKESGVQKPIWAPAPEHEMLLQAAFAPEGKAHEAGLAWLATANLAAQNSFLNRMLPLVHERLLREGIDHPAMAILKGVRRQVWCRNQLLFRQAIPAVRALRLAGIDVMLLKGVALTLKYYDDYSLRPMGDFDLMVPRKNLPSAIEILGANGWGSEGLARNNLRQNILTYSHAEHFSHRSGHDVDLHWHLSPFFIDSAADASFWNASTSATLDSIDLRVLDPADQLLHVCVHGLFGSQTPGIRWIGDAIAIIRKTPQLDWNMLLIHAHERDVTVFVRAALNCLVDRFGMAVPSDVMRRVNASPPPSRKIIEYSMHHGAQLPFLKNMGAFFYLYRRVTAAVKMGGNRVSVMRYLSSYFRREYDWRLFVYTFYKLTSKMKLSIRRSLAREMRQPSPGQPAT